MENNENLKEKIKEELKNELKSELKEDIKEKVAKKKGIMSKVFSFSLDMLFTSRYLNRWAEKTSKNIENPFLKGIVEGLTYKKTYNFDNISDLFKQLNKKKENNQNINSTHTFSVWKELKGESMEEKISQEINKSKKNSINLEKNQNFNSNNENISQTNNSTENLDNSIKNSDNQNQENSINLNKDSISIENKIAPEVLQDARDRYEKMLQKNQYDENDRQRAIKNFQLEGKICKYAIYISLIFFLISLFFWGYSGIIMSIVALTFAWVKGTIAHFYLWQTQKRACLSFALFIKDDGWVKVL